MVETKLRIKDLRLALEVYEETKDDFWLAEAAHICLIIGMPLPAILRGYLITLTGDVINAKGTRASQGPHTFMKHDKYLETMRELIFLTGTTPEDAAVRIINAVIIAGEDDNAPEDSTLLNWWYNRPERYKLPTSIHDLPYDSYEQAVERHGPFCSAEASGIAKNIKGSTLEIKKELFDQE